MTLPTPPAGGQPELSKLARQITAAHRKCESSVNAGLKHAIEAGSLLIQAKECVRHGEWLSWLEEHCELDERLAQKYMQVARELPKLQANTPRVADLSFRGSLELVAKDAADTEAESASAASHPYTPFMTRKPEDRHNLASRWWDWQAKYAVLLDALGWPVDQIAESMLLADEAIQRILQPQ